MNDLVKIENRDGIQTVNARELHSFLEVQSKFADWIKNRIEKYGFIENQDFATVSKNLESGGLTKEYHVSIDMAKELSMVENNAKGREARQYFISVEKKARELQKPMNQFDMMRQQIQMLEDQEKRLSIVEAKLETSQKDFYTIAGFASLRGRKIDVTHANLLGRKAGKISREYGYEIGKASDPRYGTVNTYHLDILSTVFRDN